MAKPHILYAMTHSLYSGRARSYLIKHQIPSQELSTGHESFKVEFAQGEIAHYSNIGNARG